MAGRRFDDKITFLRTITLFVCSPLCVCAHLFGNGLSRDTKWYHAYCTNKCRLNSLGAGASVCVLRYFGLSIMFIMPLSPPFSVIYTLLSCLPRTAPSCQFKCVELLPSSRSFFSLPILLELSALLPLPVGSVKYLYFCTCITKIYLVVSGWYNTIRYQVFHRKSHLLLQGIIIPFFPLLLRIFRLISLEQIEGPCRIACWAFDGGHFCWLLFLCQNSHSIISYPIGCKSIIYSKWAKNSVGPKGVRKILTEENISLHESMRFAFTLCLSSHTNKFARNEDFTRCFFFIVSIFLLVGLDDHTIYFRSFLGSYLHYL